MLKRVDRPDVIVLGMHRSGTSLLAGTMANLGWWVADPDDQMMPQEDNPMGFWERQDIVDLNDNILLRHEQSWHTVFSENPQLNVDHDHSFSEEIAAIIQDLEQNHPYLIKDPRMCLTWPYWAKHFSGAKIIAIVRHPMEVALSLQVRNGLPISLGLGLWFRHIKCVEVISNRQSVFHVEHRNFIENTQEVTEDIIRYLVPDSLVANLSKELDHKPIVNQNLVHHRGESESLSEQYPEVARIWEKVKTGDYTNLPQNLVFISDSDHKALYRQWAQAHALSLQVKDLEAQLEQSQVTIEQSQATISDNQKQSQATISGYQKQKEVSELLHSVRELQQQGIAESVIAYQLSTMYRSSRWITKMLRTFAKGDNRDAIDKIVETLVEQNHIEVREVSPGPVREMMTLAFQNPAQFAKQLNLSRVKTALRMLVDPEARANLSIALTRYQSVAVGGKLSLFAPDNVSFEDIQIDYQASPAVSIIIPVFNEIGSTLACIKSIVESVTDISYEIIVADDCSTDETRLLAERIENLSVVSPEVNQGFLGNCNHAARSARGEFLVFLNNDTNVQRRWLEELIIPMEEDVGVGLSGSKLVYPDGRLQEAGGIVFSDASGWNYGKLDDPNAPEYNYVREVDYVSGASIALKRHLWEQLGGFDEMFRPAYYEDTDLCFQIRQLGYKVIYTPFSVVVHYEGISHGTDENAGIKKYQIKNKKKFLEKWEPQLKQEHYKDSKALFGAKVYGRDRPVVLIIDHYVPMHDRDAGSRSTRKYIELLVQEGIRVIFLGDNFYPHQPYTEQLQRLGVEVLYGDYYKDNWEKWLDENIGFISCVYIHRPHIAEKYLYKIKEICPNVRVVYFGHDLHFLRAQREAKVSGDSETNEQADNWEKIEFSIMRAVDLSLFPAEYEAEKVREMDPSIKVDHIPLYWFDDAELDSPTRLITAKNILFVGGFGHPPNRDGLVWFLDTIWPGILEQSPETKLTIIGSKCPQSIKQLQTANVQVLGEVSDAVLEDAYRKARVAIVPLRYGAGIKGKVLEAMSKGVPVCTTLVGAEGLPESEKEYLFATDSGSQFAANVLELLRDDSKVNELRLDAIDILKLHFSRAKAKSLIEFLGVAVG